MTLKAAEPLQLPCGLMLPNRLVKAAMAEQMAVGNKPGVTFQKSYGHWSKGGWGMVLTGNVMVDKMHLGSHKDVAVFGDDDQSLAAWREWATASQEKDTPVIMQINHPGRQSPIGAGKRGLLDKTIAPSAIPLNLGDSWLAHMAGRLVFGTPRELSLVEIETVIEQFVKAAQLAADAGFKGVELHAAHGYLLAQFLSPKSNARTDKYGGTATKRVTIVIEIIRRIRSWLSPDFCVGIKINSVDFQHTDGLNDILEQLELIAAEKVDFIELSGGTYEDPQMMSTTGSSLTMSDRTRVREGFFLEASRAIRERLPKTILLVTGGFRSRGGVENALASGSCDLVGIGRPAAKYPHIPNRILFDESIADSDARFDVERAPHSGWIAKKIPSISAGAESNYFGGMIPTLPQRL